MGNTITVKELKAMMDNGEDLQIIDVRESSEFAMCHICETLIPMNTIPDNVHQISRDKKVVIYCRSGARSANVVGYLQRVYNFENLYNLKGGILAWANEIDTSLLKY